MALDITILIPARDAAATIERCVRSLLDQDTAQIILIDDFSSDDTVARAQSIAGSLLKVVSPAEHINVPHARNAGLEAVKTRYGIWCDADDCYLPGRVQRLYHRLQNEDIDFISDAQELYDGKTGEKLRNLPIPAFIQSNRDKARLFERNYLPGIGHIAFDVELARKVGYDAEQFGGDDSDFVFRLIAAGARMGVCHEIGYRMYAYPGSDSRNIARQKKMVARALQKHDYTFVQSLYQAAGFSDRVTHWGLTSMAIFREDHQAALDFLESASPSDCDENQILEPDGPYPLPEGWRRSFTRGTLYLLLAEPTLAITHLEKCLSCHQSADTHNNLGLAYAQQGETARAKQHFEKALTLFPGYIDALTNLAPNSRPAVTTHPLRLQPSRSDY
ncbi:glycosyltransferase [Pelagicoccus sp. SDUM812005]|uniref:glycosyltransferase n=1 Tax=Pelagicoccus sp. SDUM812005 TaxID=3041257 RepID=UPI00280E41D8|nr:glycosyltransferase [Pelagicoccus sp. SDUM812005]MDQ8180938.1 glycosyltransferase [Pelagicoccus sp. SDUM812005]